LPTDRALPDLATLRPAGGKRSSKRDQILDVFLRQQAHLSADELFDLVRRQNPGIGRATVYRTLQWMVTARLARKVDFGEGRFRFEPSYRHPRHFHLICTTCHRSSEFLSSDVESLIEEIAAARHFTPAQSVVQVNGTCEECRTGKQTPPIDGTTTELVFARDALRMAIATERSGLEFYTRATRLTRDPRGRSVFERLAGEEREHLATLQKRYRELLAEDPQLENRPTFLFFKGAASGLFASGAEELSKGVNDEQALLSVADAGARIGIFLERQRAETALRDSERRFRALFEQAGVGVVHADLEGRGRSLGDGRG